MSTYARAHTHIAKLSTLAHTHTHTHTDVNCSKDYVMLLRQAIYDESGQDRDVTKVCVYCMSINDHWPTLSKVSVCCCTMCNSLSVSVTPGDV